jgi:CDP-diacylglycerol pyrophosphatase
MFGRRREAIAVASALLVGAFLLAVATRANPNALWNIVHGECVPDEQQHGNPSPCAKVDLTAGEAGGFAVLKDRNGDTQFLLIATQRIGGIESNLILLPGATNYFAAAWEARNQVEMILGHAMERDKLSLAVNSAIARTQNQLHIHIDCIRADVRDALLGASSSIGPQWTPLPVPLASRRYRAMRVNGSTLAGQNPFLLLAHGEPEAGADMADYTLVVVGMQFAGDVPGFVILNDRADPALGDVAHGEDLQDHACALGH